MKVVLAGGSGLIGRELSRELAGAGYTVVILSRTPEAVLGLDEGVVAARWDGRSAGALAARLDGAKGIINLAGENIGAGQWTEARKSRIRASRIQVTEAIVEALKRVDHRPEVLLQASAVGYYGPGDDGEIVETQAAGKGFLASVCVEWEEASAAVTSFGVRRVLMRTGVVLAANGGALERILLPFKLFSGGRVGSGKQWFPWVHLRDQARAIRFLLESDRASGPFNLTAPKPVTNAEMARIIGRVLGRPSFLPTPAFVLRAVLGEMAALVLEGQRAVPEKLLAAGFEFEFEDLEEALRDLVGGEEGPEVLGS